MESKLNIRRVGHLLNYELVLLRQPLLIGAGGIIAFILAISAMASSFEPRGVVNINTMKTIFSLLVSFGGAIMASFSFHRISTKGGALNYLSIPASREEKFLVIFLSTAIFYPLGATIIFLFGELIAQMGWSVTGGDFNMYVPMMEDSFQSLKYALLSFYLMHSFYFLGSIIFKKYSFLKSTVAFFVISFLMWLIGVVIFFLVIGSFGNIASYNFSIDNQTIEQYLGFIGQAIMVIIFVGLWALSFLKFKKKEV